MEDGMEDEERQRCSAPLLSEWEGVRLEMECKLLWNARKICLFGQSRLEEICNLSDEAFEYMDQQIIQKVLSSDQEITQLMQILRVQLRGCQQSPWSIQLTRDKPTLLSLHTTSEDQNVPDSTQTLADHRNQLEADTVGGYGRRAVDESLAFLGSLLDETWSLQSKGMLPIVLLQDVLHRRLSQAQTLSRSVPFRQSPVAGVPGNSPAESLQQGETVAAEAGGAMGRARWGAVWPAEWREMSVTRLKGLLEMFNLGDGYVDMTEFMLTLMMRLCGVHWPSGDQIVKIRDALLTACNPTPQSTGTGVSATSSLDVFLSLDEFISADLSGWLSPTQPAPSAAAASPTTNINSLLFHLFTYFQLSQPTALGCQKYLQIHDSSWTTPSLAASRPTPPTPPAATTRPPTPNNTAPPMPMSATSRPSAPSSRPSSAIAGGHQAQLEEGEGGRQGIGEIQGDGTKRRLDSDVITEGESTGERDAEASNRHDDVLWLDERNGKVIHWQCLCVCVSMRRYVRVHVHACVCMDELMRLRVFLILRQHVSWSCRSVSILERLILYGSFCVSFRVYAALPPQVPQLPLSQHHINNSWSPKLPVAAIHLEPISIIPTVPDTVRLMHPTIFYY
eukprot:GHVQ01036237.1.p1 GENE.GHVQ01036237.1~~GHVQ01036237.1.p1  ORF type:complete len:619 (-),score=92.46 GHVQ01036237.1:2105-3961(-)